MSKVIILTERNNQLKYEENKRLLFKSRLNMSSSHHKNFVSLSITNSQLHLKKKPKYKKEQKKPKKEKLKINPYTHKKNINYINGNSNIFKDGKSINFKNFNSTFNNFAKNIKHEIINNNIKKGNYKNYSSNKTFINKSLNNSVVGKSMLVKQIKNIEKNKIKKKEFPRAKKKILSLSNSLTKSNKDNNTINKKKYINKYFNKNNITIKYKKSNNGIKAGNHLKFPIREYKNDKKSKSKSKNKSITKGTNNSYNLFGNIKFRKSEDNTKDNIGNINIKKKIKLKKFNLFSKNSKNKKVKYNNKKINNNNIKKIFRNNQLSCKIINKTDLNPVNEKNQKLVKEKKNKFLIRRNLYNNKILKPEINDENSEKEEIKVNKIEDIYFLSEKSNKIINCDSENIQNEDEEEEDSNILSLDEVQDIIKYYDFNDIDKYNNYLFYKNDYNIFMKNRFFHLKKEFFEESENIKLIKYKKIEKHSNKKFNGNKNLNIYYKNLGIYSPIHIINSDNKTYKTYKK